MGARDAIAKLLTKGIKAYHSSPHDFDKFDLSKIGTGEGAQVYGHGLYFAENPAVSGRGGQYWEQFAHRFGGPEGQAARRLQEAGFDREGVLKTLTEHLERARAEPTNKMYGDFAKQSHIDMLQKQYDLLASGKPVGPRTYEVNINARPEQLLDWDATLGKQPAPVQDYFGKLINQFGPEMRMDAAAKVMGSRSSRGWNEITKELAAGGGVPGIKYLDQGSRTLNPQGIALVERDLAAARAAGNADRAAVLERDLAGMRPTSNYVMFDPSRIDIMKKYAVPGAVGTGAMGATFAQDQYE